MNYQIYLHTLHIKNEISLDESANKTKNIKKLPRNILVSINTQSELTAELLDPKLLGALLNSVNSTLNRKGRVTAVVAKARYQK